jgi:osmotically-inducible protein OsmY
MRTSVACAAIVIVSVHAHAQGGAVAPLAASPESASAPRSTKTADRALRKRVLTALGRAKGLRAAGITVRVNNAAVVLQGGVPEQAQIDQAARVAQGVPGVATVKNELTLSTF